jgi:hypothetical protein
VMAIGSPRATTMVAPGRRIESRGGGAAGSPSTKP